MSLIRKLSPLVPFAVCVVVSATMRSPVTLAQASGSATQARPVTFGGEIGAILFDRCVKCHHPDGPAPFSLASYPEARRRASQIAAVTASRSMPPWKAEPGFGEFVGQKTLSDAEIALIERWVSDGAIEGDTRNLKPPSWTAGWQLGSPDLVLKLPQPYSLRAEGADVWRVFVFPVPVRSLKYVRGLEFRPGNTKAVHHARIRTDRTRASRQLDEQDPEPGYQGLILRSAVYPDGHFLGWTPGQAGPMLPKGLAWRIEPGVDLVVEMHMVPSGRTETVEPSIGLFFTSDPPEQTPAMLRLGRKNIDIAPGDNSYVSADSFVLPVDVEVQAVQPHAHYRARRILATATLPDGSTRPLIYIADWDVRWQHLYQYVAPVALPKGTTIAMQFTFDNSAANFRNPQLPPRRVVWGEEATSEMGELWVQMLTRTARDLGTLNAAVEPKMVGEDVIGYEARLRDDPSSVPLHDDAADGYLYLGQPDKAVAHFQESLRLSPGSAPAYYNLGIALAEAGNPDSAIKNFQQALRIRPDYAAAHNNLGSVLSNAGRQEEALAHFLEAARIDPANADSHFNAASLLYSHGELAKALTHFRRAADLRPDWPPAVSSLAWLLATAPLSELRNPVEAVGIAERATQLTERLDAGVLDVLAAALASAGRFAQADAIAEEALALGPAPRIAAAIRVRQRLYRQNRAFQTPLRR